MLTTAPVLAIVWAQSIPYRLLYRSAIPRPLLRRVVALSYMVFTLLFIVGLVAFIYFLPGAASGVPRISRGGLALAAITNSKFGLGTIGTAVGLGVFILQQFILFGAVGTTFALLKPFQSKEISQ